MESENVCDNCFWFMLIEASRKCCYAASPNHATTDPRSTCKDWREKKSQSQRLRMIRDKQCGF